mmetsp:Transcript_56319/g.132728  ORF Transcript_56319/g.132728 Transcript_56319/m.132728 type:complete len:115 (-) Transcript_56319:237-581(-)
MPALTYVYGATLGIGGIFGYAGRGSKESLVWGLFFGTILCWCGLRMKDRGPGVRGYPFAIALLASAVLFFLSVNKAMQRGKLWPAAAVAALSFIMGLRYASHFTVYGDLYEYGV